jgi:outer membrane lipoprotein-sorting protein
MKIKQLLSLLFVSAIAFSSYAQTADEIISKYLETVGGNEKLKAIEALKMTGKANQQGLEFPMTQIQMKDGRQFASFTFQGKELKQGVFDGTTMWSTNFVNMKAEKSDAESTENFKANKGGDFPMSFYDYKKFGYKAEFLGKETIEGTETFKVKLTKNPVKVDGTPKENFEIYYFDAENYVPILVESEISSGPAKGMTAQTKLSDYQEVNGIFFPFTIAQGAKGQGIGITITITNIEINPKIDASLFAMPAEN